MLFIELKNYFNSTTIFSTKSTTTLATILTSVKTLPVVSSIPNYTLLAYILTKPYSLLLEYNSVDI